MQDPRAVADQNHRIRVKKYCVLSCLQTEPDRFYSDFILFIFSSNLNFLSQGCWLWWASRAECWVLHVCISTQQKLSYCLYYLCALGCDFSFRSSVTNWCAWTGDTKERIWTHTGKGFISHCTALVWAAFTDKSPTLTLEVSNRIIF